MSEYTDLVKVYIQDINQALKEISDEDILEVFKRLYEKEQFFAKKLQSTVSGRKVYMSFIHKISGSRGGIKVARSYFRARQEDYLETVNRAIREVQPKLMYQVPINYRFCLFTMQTLDDYAKKKNEPKSPLVLHLEKLFLEIKLLREEIINKHLYLSLHKAGIYKKSWAGGTTEFEDLIQLANEGLVIAVDKYVMDGDSSSFHMMAIGRIVSNLITNGSNSSAATIGEHAKKKLYQIRKLIQKMPQMQNREIAEALKIAEEEVNDLMSANSYKSLDETISDDSNVRLIDTFIAPNNGMSEFEILENEEVKDVLNDSFSVLSLIEKKVLRLKGIKIK